MTKNRDILKELKVGMTIAVEAEERKFPRLGTIRSLPSDLSLTTELEVHWMVQERSPHKPKWLRFWSPSTRRNAVGYTRISGILVYDFQLTKHGALNKKSREYLQSHWK